MSTDDLDSKTDVRWRDIAYDYSIFEEKNKERAVLILTNVMDKPSCPRSSLAKYVEIFNNRCRLCDETVTHYAFLTA